MGVGRLIGRLLGGDAGENEVVLRAYGKLPLYAEYRRLELSPGTPTAFSQWLDAGRLAWVRSPNKSETGAMRPSRLLVGLPDTKEVVVASVWDSRDSLGRVFPFAFFVVCTPESLGKDPVERWAAASGVHRQFDRLYAELHALGSGGDFYRVYQKRTIVVRPEGFEERVRRLREDAGRIMTDDWFKALTLDDAITPGTLFGGLQRRGARWRAQPGALGDLALSFPLARGFAYEAQAVLWLGWLGNLLRKVNRTPGLVVPMGSDRSASAMHLIVRAMLPDDYQLLTTDDHAYGFAEHLSTPVEDASAPAAEADEPRESLLAWVERHRL